MLLMDEPELYARKALRSSPGQLSMFTGLEHTGTAADFREDLHPRDDDGKFRPKGVAKPGQGPTVEESPTGQRKRTLKSSAGQMPLPLGDEDVAEAKRLIQQMRGEVGPRTPPGEKPFTLSSGKPEPVKPSGNTVQKPLFGEKPAAPMPPPPTGKAQQKPLFGEDKPAAPDIAAKAPDVTPAQAGKPKPDWAKDPELPPNIYEAKGPENTRAWVAKRQDGKLAVGMHDDDAGKRVGELKIFNAGEEDKAKAYADSIVGKAEQLAPTADKKNAWDGRSPEDMAISPMGTHNPMWYDGHKTSGGMTMHVEAKPDGTYSAWKAFDANPELKVHVSAGKDAEMTMNNIWRGGVGVGPGTPQMEELIRKGMAKGEQKPQPQPAQKPADPEFSLSAKPKHTPGKIEGMGKAKQVDLFAGRGDSPGQTSFFDDIDPAAKNVGAMGTPKQRDELGTKASMAAGGDFQIAGMSLEKAAKLAEENGHPDAMEKIRSRPSAWKDVLEQWRDAKKSSAAQKSRDTRAANWKPNEMQQGVLDKVGGGGRNFPRSQDMLMWGQNKAATQQLIDRGLLERTDNGREVSYRLLQPATNAVATPQTEWNPDALAKSASDPHAELIERAGKYAEYGQNYNRNIAAPLNRLLEAKAKGHNPAMLDRMADELRMRLEHHGKPAEGDIDIDALAKSAVDSGENIWSHARAAGHNAIKDWSSEQRQAYSDAVNKHREAAKPQPSEGRARAMAAQQERDEAGTNVKHSPAMQEAIKQVSEKLGIAPAPAADTQPKPETPASRPLDDKIASSGGLIAKIGKQMGVKPQDMEDFISDVQLKAIQGQGGYDAEKGEFSTWLATVARNHKMTQQARQKAGKRAGVTQSLATPLEGGKGSLADTVAAKPEKREIGDALDVEKVREAMGSLPDKQREAFMAVMTGGKSVTEAAEEMGISKQAVSAYVNLAKAKIKAAVGVEDEAEPAKEPPKPATAPQTLAEKVAAQRAAGKKATPPKAKPKPKTMVSMSGGRYELVKENDDGTVTVKNDQGDEFTSDPGEDYQIEQRKTAWKKNEDGTYTAPNGVVWRKAAAGGEESPVNGKPYAGGSLMPIHGLHQNQPEKPKPQAAGDASAVKPNENAKQAKPAEPRAPMSPEMIEAERQRRAKEAQWSTVRGGHVGELLAMGDRPHRLKRTDGGTRRWEDMIESAKLSPEQVKELADHYEGKAKEAVVKKENASPEEAGSYLENANLLIEGGKPYWRKGKLKTHPDMPRASHFVSDYLDATDDQGKGLHEFHEHIEKLKRGESLSPPTAAPGLSEPPAKSGPPGVSHDDIPFQVAYNAHAGISHVPEDRARQRQKDYVNQLTGDWEYLSSMAETPEQKEQLAQEWERYRAGFRDKSLAVLHAGSRVMSPMITGPARFPTERNQKRFEAYDKRVQELIDFRKKALAAIGRKVAPGEGGPIMSSDANAVESLQKRLAELEQHQNAAKEANKIIRSHIQGVNRAGKSVTYKPGKTREDAIRAIVAAGLSEEAAGKALLPDVMGDVGFPQYHLSNNSANIRRIKQRIAQVSAMKAGPAKSEEYSGGVSVHEDPEAARIRIKFPGKPERDTIAKLKSGGFRWSPTEGAWQRHLNNAGRYAVQSLLTSLGHQKQPSQQQPQADGSDIPDFTPLSDED